MEGPASVCGKNYPVEYIRSSNKHASARLRHDRITISIPSRWPANEADKIKKRLLERAIRNIAKGRWGTREMRKTQFSHGQEFEIMGRKFRITDPAKHDKIRKGIVNKVLPELERRVREINSAHFNSEIKKITIRDNLSRWGSFAGRGNVSLNFKLLFAPPEILDYVIVHELAHSRYKSHGPRFWAVVEGVIPDHKEKRKWLRENGHALGPSTNQI